MTKLERVKLMASGSPTWDLSPNDLIALKAVVAVAEWADSAAGYSGSAGDHVLQDAVAEMNAPDGAKARR